MKKKNKISSNYYLVITKINLVNHQHIFQSVILILFFLFVLISTISCINVYDDFSNHDSSTLCVIGQLRKCNDDEDCAELEEKHQQYLNANLSFGQRAGTCVCRNSDHCKRNNKQKQQSDQLYNSDQSNSYSSKLIISILICLTIVGICSFLVYFYGIRYGMIRRFARRFGLINQNAQVEDNQLLNRVVSNRDEDVELTI